MAPVKNKYRVTRNKSYIVYKTLLSFLLMATAFLSMAQETAAIRTIVVDARGDGDFRNIQEAINSLPDTAASMRRIYIRNGTYREKIFIKKHLILLEGESREGTVITQDIARDEWRCQHADDWGVATINVDANDLSLLNLTVANDYGFNNKENRQVPCEADSVTHTRVISPRGHQMALRSFSATRLRAENCHFRAFAGDTVSPWNLDDGMFYFYNCIMEGGVDLYCPRGWAWAENCRFYAHGGSAILWHDGSGNETFKTVLKNCSFDGFAGFALGRYHRDAQFILIDCRFSKNMADKNIFLVPTSNVLQWGRRVYFYNCHREGGDFAWFANNMDKQVLKVQPQELKPAWLFGDRWKSL